MSRVRTELWSIPGGTASLQTTGSQMIAREDFTESFGLTKYGNSKSISPNQSSMRILSIRPMHIPLIDLVSLLHGGHKAAYVCPFYAFFIIRLEMNA
jgi:hypothetical protein